MGASDPRTQDNIACTCIPLAARLQLAGEQIEAAQAGVGGILLLRLDLRALQTELLKGGACYSKAGNGQAVV